MAITVSSPWQTKTDEVMQVLQLYRLKQLEYNAERALYDAMLPSGVGHLSNMPAVRSDVFEPERYAARRIAQSDRIAKIYSEAQEALKAINVLLDKLTGTDRLVLYLKHIRGETFEEMAMIMFCHRQTARVWHDAAVNKLCKL